MNDRTIIVYWRWAWLGIVPAIYLSLTLHQPLFFISAVIAYFVCGLNAIILSKTVQLPAATVGAASWLFFMVVISSKYLPLAKMWEAKGALGIWTAAYVVGGGVAVLFLGMAIDPIFKKGAVEGADHSEEIQSKSGESNSKMMKAIGVTLGVLVVAGLVLAIVPTSRDEVHWRWATHYDKTESYESYLKSWPSGRHAAEAKDSIESLELKLALTGKSLSLLRYFIKKYPNSSLVETAQRKLISLEDTDWETARQNNSIYSYKDYLSNYPDGGHVKEAKARIQILEFHSAFIKTVKFTEEQVRAYMESLENEKYSTVIKKPLEFYTILDHGQGIWIKRKEVVKQSPDQKACSLQLEAENLSITAIYISNPPFFARNRPLFPQKLKHTMTHNGSAGPGLEIHLASHHLNGRFGKFLDNFSIFYHEMRDIYGAFGGYAIPDLVWGSDQDGSPHPHRGHIFKFKPKNGIVFKVDGFVGIPNVSITTYKQALALKTYLKIISNK